MDLVPGIGHSSEIPSFAGEVSIHTGSVEQISSNLSNPSKSDGSNGKNSPDSAEVSKNKRRTMQACTRCQRRKVKCDGRSPCTNCVSASVNCEFSKATIRRGPRAGELKKLREVVAETEKKEILMSSGMLVTKNTLEGTTVNRAAYSAKFPEMLTGIPKSRLVLYACTYFDQTNLILPMCSEWHFYQRSVEIMDSNTRTEPNQLPVETLVELLVLALGARLCEDPENGDTLFSHAQAGLSAKFELVHSVMAPALILAGYYSYATNALDFAVLYYTRAHMLFGKVVVDEMTELSGNALSGMAKLLVSRGKLGKQYRRTVVMSGGTLDLDHVNDDADNDPQPPKDVVKTILTCGSLSWQDKGSDIVRFQMSLPQSQQNQLHDDPVAVSRDPATMTKVLREYYTVISEISTALHSYDNADLAAMESHLRSRLNFADLLLSTFKPNGSHLNSTQVLLYSLRTWIYRRLGPLTSAMESADQALGAAISNRSYKAWCPFFHVCFQHVAAVYKEAHAMDKYNKARTVLQTILPKWAPVVKSTAGSDEQDYATILPEGVIIDEAFLDTSGWEIPEGSFTL